ncbi:MAG: hypothetical protein WC974_07990 [Thermoplasmata archaeon]
MKIDRLNKLDTVKIGIIATDGVEYKKCDTIIFIWKKERQFISYAFGNSHTTFHQSGEIHRASKQQKPYPVIKGKPLLNFKGHQHMCRFEVVNNFENLKNCKPVKNEKLDILLYLDFRKFKEEKITLDLYLLEESNLQEVFEIIRDGGYNSLYTIITLTSPWMLIAYR